MAKLKDIDKAAENKGKGVTTLWQFIKFIVVSLGAMIVQFGLLNILQAIPAVQELYAQAFQQLQIGDIFLLDYPVKYEAGVIVAGGLGYCIAFNVSNIVAQIVAFFINKEKTFNSGANIAVVLPIYIVFTIALILFSAWLSPTLMSKFQDFGWSDTLASNAAAMVCAALQFFLYFPVDKILFHKKKEEKAE